MQRGDGGAEIRFARRTDGVTALAHLWQSDPCRVLFPRPEADEPTQAVIVTTSGGLTDGDRVRLAVEVDGGIATVTTQAAEKIYRAARAAEQPARIESTLRVGAGATLEWLPQETIVFDGARLRRRVEADLADDARLLACEMVVLGRSASGEQFQRGAVHDGWRLRRAGKLVWADALALDGAPPAVAGFAGATALATGIFVAPEAARWLEAGREVVEPCAARAGVTVVNGVLLARFLGEPLAVRRGLMDWLAFMRQEALGGPRRLPRVWHV
ncbi:MAG: urease accessory protein UreD [Reyranellaceae bacterium]